MSEPGDNFPSFGEDPANDGSLGGAFRAICRKVLMNTDGMLPCKVIAVTPDRKFVTVQPMIQIVGTGGEKMSRAQIAKVPAIAIGAGNWIMSYPVKPNDLGWIVASDRDISLYIQANAEAAPNTGRIHSFSDGLFIPDKARDEALTIAAGDADKATWQSLDGTVKITLGTDKISVVHPTLVEVTTPHETVKGGDFKVEKGIAFWNHAVPGTQPAVTGALSTVGDAAAKAVLTSIKNIMVACGQATDGTT